MLVYLSIILKPGNRTLYFGGETSLSLKSGHLEQNVTAIHM